MEHRRTFSSTVRSRPGAEVVLRSTDSPTSRMLWISCARPLRRASRSSFVVLPDFVLHAMRYLRVRHVAKRPRESLEAR